MLRRSVHLFGTIRYSNLSYCQTKLTTRELDQKQFKWYKPVSCQEPQELEWKNTIYTFLRDYWHATSLAIVGSNLAKNCIFRCIQSRQNKLMYIMDKYCDEKLFQCFHTAQKPVITILHNTKCLLRQHVHIHNLFSNLKYKHFTTVLLLSVVVETIPTKQTRWLDSTLSDLSSGPYTLGRKINTVERGPTSLTHYYEQPWTSYK